MLVPALLFLYQQLEAALCTFHKVSVNRYAKPKKEKKHKHEIWALEDKMCLLDVTVVRIMLDCQFLVMNKLFCSF